jgi:hypothetical protein
MTNKLFVTFGQIHVHSVNGKTFDKDCVAVIYCNDESHGRALAFEYFGNKWHHGYFNTYPVGMMEYFPRGFIEVNRP